MQGRSAPGVTKGTGASIRSYSDELKKCRNAERPPTQWRTKVQPKSWTSSTADWWGLTLLPGLLCWSVDSPPIVPTTECSEQIWYECTQKCSFIVIQMTNRYPFSLSDERSPAPLLWKSVLSPVHYTQSSMCLGSLFCSSMKTHSIRFLPFHHFKTLHFLHLMRL